MKKFTEEELGSALAVVTSAIRRCRNMQPKFPQGTSHCSLLRNRIRALEIAEGLLLDEEAEFDGEALKKALPPILSIHSKTTNARKKYQEGSAQYRRFTPTIEAMEICRELVENAIRRKEGLQ